MPNVLYKKPLILIPVIMAAAIGLVAILGWIAISPLSQKNGFDRKFMNTELQSQNIIDKPAEIVDIAGKTANQIYFKTQDPRKIYVTDSKLQNGKYLLLNLHGAEKNLFQFGCTVDSPNIYVFSGNARKIIHARSGDSLRIRKFPDALFTRAIFISEKTVVFRMFEHLDQIFAKGDLSSGKLTKENGISPKNNDIGLATDGLLRYDKKTNSVIYIHCYTNKILLLDTNLNLLRTMHTIDTITNSGILPGKIDSEGVITNVGAKRLINAECSIQNGYLYINSKIIADNENKTDFIKNSTIDIYDIESGQYKGSLYIPSPDNEKLSAFEVINNEIIAIYKNKIASYKIP